MTQQRKPKSKNPSSAMNKKLSTELLDQSVAEEYAQLEVGNTEIIVAKTIERNKLETEKAMKLVSSTSQQIAADIANFEEKVADAVVLISQQISQLSDSDTEQDGSIIATEENLAATLNDILNDTDSSYAQSVTAMDVSEKLVAATDNT